MAAAVEGSQVDVDNALLIETQYFVSLATGQVSKNMIKAFFFDLQGIMKGSSRPEGFGEVHGEEDRHPGRGHDGRRYRLRQRAFRYGGHPQGRLAGVRAEGQGLQREVAGQGRGPGKMTREAADEVLARITATDNPADAKGADLLIEAVFEDPSLKHKVYAEIEPFMAEDSLLASNTSTLPVTGLAKGVTRPQDFIGMHFFSPVDKMPLLEIVVGGQTSDAAIAKAVDVALQIKKTPIVVNDSRGFFTSRVIGTFMGEAAAMLAEGIPAAGVHRAGFAAGGIPDWTAGTVR